MINESWSGYWNYIYTGLKKYPILEFSQNRNLHKNWENQFIKNCDPEIYEYKSEAGSRGGLEFSLDWVWEDKKLEFLGYYLAEFNGYFKDDLENYNDSVGCFFDTLEDYDMFPDIENPFINSWMELLKNYFQIPYNILKEYNLPPVPESDWFIIKDGLQKIVPFGERWGSNNIILGKDWLGSGRNKTVYKIYSRALQKWIVIKPLEELDKDLIKFINSHLDKFAKIIFIDWNKKIWGQELLNPLIHPEKYYKKISALEKLINELLEAEGLDPFYDIHPGNVGLDERGNLKIFDW
jgi:hypothetical protein